MRRILLLLVPAVCVLLLAGCGDDPDVSTGPGTAPGTDPGPDSGDGPSDLASALDGRRFVAQAVTERGEDRPLVAGTTLTVIFEDGDVGFQAGCNTTSGPYEIRDGVLVVGGLMGTQMGCEPDLHEQDEWLAGFFESSPTVSLDADWLVLATDVVLIELEDEAASRVDLPLVGTAWVLDTIIDGEVASSVPVGVEATVRIEEDRTVAMDAGCNGIGGDVEVGEGELVLGALERTLMACPGPEVQVEVLLMSLEGRTVAFEIEGDRLSLRWEDQGLELRAAG